MKINVNGQDYDSWDEVPEQLRNLVASTGALPDTNHDGVPDLFEGGAIPPAARIVSRSTQVTVGGVTYDSVDEIPPQVRASLEAAGLLGAQAPTGPSGAVLPHFAAQEPMAPPVISPPSSDVLLNGVPVSSDDPAKPKRWWRRG